MERIMRMRLQASDMEGLYKGFKGLTEESIKEHSERVEALLAVAYNMGFSDGRNAGIVEGLDR